MTMNKARRALLFFLFAILGATACKPQRLRQVSQKEDTRGEAQIRAERLRQEGERLFDAGDLESAQKALVASLREHPEQFEAHDRLGQLYEVAGRPLAAWVEFAAAVELLRSSRQRMERMVSYIVARYSRDPDRIREISPAQKGKAMLALSEALLDFESGRQAEALRRIDSARPDMPGAGVCDYLAGHILLRAGNVAGARERFVLAAGENGYIARRLLAEGADQKDPELMPALADVLRRELESHPSDLESALMLSVLRLRLGDPQAALDAIAKGQTWSPPRWDLLVLKAAALDRLGQKARADQALADLRGVRPDISLTFAGYEPSLFFGPLQRTLDSFFLERVAPARPEPERSFLTWLLLREAGDDRAEEARAAFAARLSEQFAGQEFQKSSAPAGSARFTKYEEYLGEAERILREARPALLSCERTRRTARPNPSANLALKIKILGDGTVAGIGIDDESLGDPWVVYCVAGRVMGLSFPPSPRGIEVLPLPLLFGPEADVEDREKS